MKWFDYKGWVAFTAKVLFVQEPLMKRAVPMFLFVLCFLLLIGQADACRRNRCCSPLPVCPSTLEGVNPENYGVKAGDMGPTDGTRAIWWEYYGEVLYSGTWHYDGRYRHPDRNVVLNNRAQYLAGATNRRASMPYQVNQN